MRWPRSAAPAASAPMPASTRRRVHAAAAGLRLRRRRGLRLHLRHLAPRADRPRRSCKAGETVLVLGAAGGVGTAAIQIAKAAGARVIAAASSDEKCALCRELGADATINYSSDEPARRAEGADRRQGPGRRLRPGRRRPRRAGVPLDRLARPLSRGRLRRRRHPGAAAEPGAAQGRLDRRRVLGRLRAARAAGQRRRRMAAAGALVRRRARSSR